MKKKRENRRNCYVPAKNMIENFYQKQWNKNKYSNCLFSRSNMVIVDGIAPKKIKITN
jgi:hypothetical protein